MRRLTQASVVCAFLLALLAVPTLSSAAIFTTMQSAAVATGNGVPLTVNDKGTVGASVTGTFVGTITWEGSTDGSTTWSSTYCSRIDTLVSDTTTTTTGQFICNTAGFTGFRARISAYTSGSITVTGFPTAAGGGGGAGGGGSLSATATAAAPSYVEGYTQAALSVDLSGNLRTTMGTLLAGEDQPNNLLMTSGGKARQLQVLTNVSTNTTSATFLLPVGVKSGDFSMVCNAGASTDCTIAIAVFGNFKNTTTNGQLLCNVVLPTGSATTIGICPDFSTNFAYYFFTTTAVAGTSPVLNGYVHF
jgi:hypothetical protein